MAPDSLKLGFACAWDNPPEKTWSHAPWTIRKCLLERTDVVDLGLEWSTPVRSALRGLGAYRHNGTWRTQWTRHPVTLSLAGRQLRAAERRLRPDVVLQFGDLARLDTPYLLYQDLSFDIVMEHLDPATGRSVQAPGLSLDDLKRLRDRQLSIYAEASGVLAMSHWLADHLVRVTGLPEEKVHVVLPGANSLPAVPPATRREAPRKRLLFVGIDFHRKAGDLVVAATQILRREVDPGIELTIVGPPEWPLPGPVPDGVRFLGKLPPAEVRPLYAEHDVLVMPSRFEAYGLAFIEALAHGIPCVARRAYAMTEIIEPGVNGDLVDGDDPEVLARTIAGVLGNDEIYTRILTRAEALIQHYTWDRVADDIVRIAKTAR